MREQGQQETAQVRAKAAILEKYREDLGIHDVVLREIGAEEVRVKVKGVGICHTDIVCRDGFPVPTPIVLGHEGAGVVEAIGEAVETLVPGDHVVLTFNHCGTCHNCHKGRPAYCHNFGALNFGGVPGSSGRHNIQRDGEDVHGNFFGQSSFSSYAIANVRNTVRVGKEFPLELLGPLGCGVQTGAGAIMNAFQAGRGESVVIFGGGGVGMSALLAAHAIGLKRIVLVEPSDERRELGRALGATTVIDPNAVSGDLFEEIRSTAGGGVEYVLDTTGIPSLIEGSLKLFNTGGVLGLIGVSPPEELLPARIMDILLGGVTIKGILEGDSNPSEFIPRLLSLYGEGLFPFDKLIKTYRFEEINEAMRDSERGKTIKPVLVFE